MVKRYSLMIIVGTAICLASRYGEANVSRALAPASVSSSQTNRSLGFGFDKLRWGMMGDEVLRVYPDLQTSDPLGTSSDKWPVHALGYQHHTFLGCHFVVGLYFIDLNGDPSVFGTLGNINLVMTEKTDDCALRVRSFLLRKYGKANENQLPETVQLLWKVGTTHVSYTDWKPHTGKRSIMITLTDHKHLESAVRMMRGQGK